MYPTGRFSTGQMTPLALSWSLVSIRSRGMGYQLGKMGFGSLSPKLAVMDTEPQLSATFLLTCTSIW
jgi:hypothetical protein